jgi:peptidyl-prolyl cis-trans isomerase SurA
VISISGADALVRSFVVFVSPIGRAYRRGRRPANWFGEQVVTIRRFRPLALCILLLAAMLPVRGALAVTIEVVVNGVQITSYDIQQRVALLRISGQTPSTSVATNQLIDEIIQIQEALRLGITVRQSQVDAAFASIAQQVGMGVGQFEGALREAGVEPNSLKRQIQAQIYWSLLVQARLQTTPAINQQAVTEALLAQGAANQTVREYQMQQIIFVVPANSTNAYVNQRQNEANAFRQRFTGCENTLAQTLSLRDVTVRELGRDTTALTQVQLQAVQSTQAGRTTSPARTSRGIELIAVCSITEVAANEQLRTDLQNQLLIDLGPQVGQAYLAELRERAVIIYY